ncbi:DUF6458 family protein [Kineococcus sp. NBC_00420]|uniref:DUF6458 family protein n=1 Tax=unclassified Kineococcus TaxID=2621656 RepID=UPI002E1D595B
MRTGNSCCLLTIGAILAFAVHVDLDVVDVATVGWILMLVAVVGAFVDLAVVRPRARAARVEAELRLASTRPVARTPQTSWSSWDTRAFTPVQRPHQES